MYYLLQRPDTKKYWSGTSWYGLIDAKYYPREIAEKVALACLDEINVACDIIGPYDKFGKLLTSQDVKT